MRIHFLCGSNFFCARTKSSGRCTTSKSHPYFVFLKKKLFFVFGVQILHMHPNSFEFSLKSRIFPFERDRVFQTKILDSGKLLRASNFFCTCSKSSGRCSTFKSHPYFFLFEKKTIIFVVMLQNRYFRTRLLKTAQNDK